MIIYQLEVVSIICFKFHFFCFASFFENRDDLRYFIITFEEECVSNLFQTKSSSFHKIIHTNIYWGSGNTFILGSKMFNFFFGPISNRALRIDTII